MYETEDQTAVAVFSSPVDNQSYQSGSGPVLGLDFQTLGEIGKWLFQESQQPNPDVGV